MCVCRISVSLVVVVAVGSFHFLLLFGSALLIRNLF